LASVLSASKKANKMSASLVTTVQRNFPFQSGKREGFLYGAILIASRKRLTQSGCLVDSRDRCCFWLVGYRFGWLEGVKPRRRPTDDLRVQLRLLLLLSAVARIPFILIAVGGTAHIPADVPR
jgi:hypothetical protein